MQVHALHQPLDLHPQERGARGAEREALLLHGAQVAGADAVAHVGEFEGAGVLAHRFLQDLLALSAARTALLRVQVERLVQRVNLHLALGGSFVAKQ